MRPAVGVPSTSGGNNTSSSSNCSTGTTTTSGPIVISNPNNMKSISNNANRIRKLRSERMERKLTMAKLQRMVPNARSGISELDLINHIINYIRFLQETLQNESDLNRENREPSGDSTMTVLSQMLERFGSEPDDEQQRVPLRSSAQIC